MSNVIPLKKNANGRNGLIAKIHVAKKQLCMEDDSYRALLQRVTGKDSAAQLSVYQLEAVLEEFQRLGFAKVKPRAGKRKLADDEQSKKIRALWLNLYHLGELRDASEDALAGYVKRMSKVAALQWLTTYEADQVIRGLRGWLERLGWKQPSDSTVNGVYRYRKTYKVDENPDAVNYFGVVAKAAIIRKQYEILELNIGSFIPELMDASQMDGLIETLGVKCRAVKQKKES